MAEIVADFCKGWGKETARWQAVEEEEKEEEEERADLHQVCAEVQEKAIECKT